MRTNQDIYQLASQLARAPEVPSLTRYLGAMRWLVERARDETPSPDLLARLLEGAMVAPPQAFDPAAYTPNPSATGHAAVLEVLSRQLRDLTEMTATGIIDDPHRFFGIDAPSGARWYNFTVAGYLECGIRGTMGGYDDDDIVRLVVKPPDWDPDHDPPDDHRPFN